MAEALGTAAHDRRRRLLLWPDAFVALYRRRSLRDPAGRLGDHSPHLSDDRLHGPDRTHCPRLDLDRWLAAALGRKALAESTSHRLRHRHARRHPLLPAIEAR